MGIQILQVPGVSPKNETTSIRCTADDPREESERNTGNILSSDQTSLAGESANNLSADLSSLADESTSKSQNLSQCHVYGDNSDASTCSETSGSAGGVALPMPSLRKNICQRKNQDPFIYYKVVEKMGVGSMGSVSKVKKRDRFVGGSARLDLSNRSMPEVMMMSMESIPIMGMLIRTCVGRSRTRVGSVDSDLSDLSTAGSFRSQKWSALLSRRKDVFEPSQPGVGSERHSLGSSFRSETKSHFSTISHDGNYQLHYAVKSINLNRITDEKFVTELRNEIEILKSLDHPHIVRPIETYEHRRKLYLVMELCTGGDLYSRDPYSEGEAARIINSILDAVAYMHAHNITHRDLKFENIMFANSSPNAEVKVIDFGLSKKYGPENPIMTECVGTIYTMAPEVLKRGYTSKADLWSVGVLAFMLLSSQFPFYGKRKRDIVEKMMSCNYEFRGRRWNEVSAEAKSFVTDLLQLDPDKRPDAAEALQTSWLSRPSEAGFRASENTAMDNVQATLETFSHYTELKKLALMVVAHKSTCEEIGYLRKAFQKFDRKRDGMISFSEFKEGLKGHGYTENALEQMFHGVNLDHTGKIHYTEFLAATIEARGALHEERIAEAFDLIDCDGSGYITASDLRVILGEQLPQTELENIVDECDLTRDHRISYDEFLALWDQQDEIGRPKGSLFGLTVEEDCPSDFPSGSESDFLGHVSFCEEKKKSVRKRAKELGTSVA